MIRFLSINLLSARLALPSVIVDITMLDVSTAHITEWKAFSLLLMGKKGFTPLGRCKIPLSS